MTPLTVGLLSVIALIILILCGVRIAFAMGIVTVVGFFLISGNPAQAVSLIGSTFFSGIKEYGFAVLPLFIMVGCILSVSNLGDDIYQSSEVIMRRIPGGLAVATVVANAIFAAIVGSSIASAAAFSKIAYGPMTKQGYEKKFALGCVAGSSVLGMLIPPSLLFILYGMLTGASVGKMFMAGIVPGIILAAMFSVEIIVRVLRNPQLAPKDNSGEKKSIKENLHLLLKPWGCILLIVVVLGGIYIGYFTPTEAGAIAVVGALLVALGYKRLNWENLKQIIRETSETSGSVLLLLVTAKMFSRLIALSGCVNWLNSAIVNSGLSITLVLIIVLLIVVIMGCMLDSSSIFMLILPMMLPILQANGVDLIWFGVILTISTEMGLITPPFGVSVFTVKSCMGDAASVEDIFSGSLPYLISMVAIIILLFIFPSLTTWLPSHMM